ncbi:putative cytochrome P450 [Tripterygium wilfordii]|uniref:Putative cytochrome P450 n=1 Tax=Tripterygium wilfordii TaxID=458696 RepID=A0A7J7CZ44_TRIWF|nr:putative cytochrome P450 [Tripterygium wilfordii]
MVPVLIFIVALPIILFFFLQKHKSVKNICLPPGPKGLPLIGNLHQLDNSNLPHYLWQLAKQYGPLMFMRFGFRPTIVISSAKMAKEVLQTHDLVFCSRPALRGQQTLSYNGVDLAFAPYGAYWREMRKICVVHLFSSIRVQTYRPIREYEVSLLLGKILKSVDASKPVNLTEALMSLANHIICRIALGKRYEDEGVERSRFQSLLNEVQALFVTNFFSDYFPFMSWLDRLTGQLSRLHKSFVQFDQFYNEIIQDHLDPKRPKPEQDDILDVLLQQWKDQSFKVDVTLDHIKAVLMNVFVAGTDTSAAAVVWAMTFLMKNPRTMKKAQEEIRNLLGERFCQ